MISSEYVVSSSVLKKIPSVHHAFFTREGGVSHSLYSSLNGGLGSQDNSEHIMENRQRMAGFLQIEPQNFLSLYQIHSKNVVVVDQPWNANSRPQADAMVTDQPGVALAIATADCGPVLFVDAQSGVIGAAHAGWKGAIGGILEATIEAMEQLGANRLHVTAVLGPTISQEAYEVGEDFKSVFCNSQQEYQQFFKPGQNDGKFYFNLPGFIKYRLNLLNIKCFQNLSLCTYQDEKRFYSYRRSTHQQENDYGRLISAICLKNSHHNNL